MCLAFEASATASGSNDSEIVNVEVIDVGSAPAEEFTEQATSSPKVSAAVVDYLSDAAAGGIFLDTKQVEVASTPNDVLVVTTDMAGIGEVGVTEEMATDESGQILYEEQTLSVDYFQSPDDAPITAVPVGPGGAMSLTDVAGTTCTTLFGSTDPTNERYGNTMRWCRQKRFLDGGNGVKSYGLADDDGSKRLSR